MMANISYLWQLVNSMRDATARLEQILEKDEQTEVSKIKAFIFDLQQAIKQEIEQKSGK
jgi:hypothetical protein